MAENTMKLEVITPERSFYTGDVIFVELNTTEGEVGIYARHIPMHLQSELLRPEKVDY